ncbi:hypothetical protein BVC71_14215 [Marivivens niveibacter]|uniref:Uncharacterized protein n=1 Tax=Marivivens niveibacter TaxID=1930667 RepID=A0A251WV94_9RHOB|nr:hypothetical protein [Marivivens niveibacter]OUD08322.1 hypothetical protein BVC71_14215 [Marivivens niveibacter]
MKPEKLGFAYAAQRLGAEKAVPFLALDPDMPAAAKILLAQRLVDDLETKDIAVQTSDTVTNRITELETQLKQSETLAAQYETIAANETKLLERFEAPLRTMFAENSDMSRADLAGFLENISREPPAAARNQLLNLPYFKSVIAPRKSPEKTIKEISQKLGDRDDLTAKQIRTEIDNLIVIEKAFSKYLKSEDSTRAELTERIAEIEAKLQEMGGGSEFFLQAALATDPETEGLAEFMKLVDADTETAANARADMDAFVASSRSKVEKIIEKYMGKKSARSGD